MAHEPSICMQEKCQCKDAQLLRKVVYPCIYLADYCISTLFPHSTFSTDVCSNIFKWNMKLSTKHKKRELTWMMTIAGMGSFLWSNILSTSIYDLMLINVCHFHLLLHQTLAQIFKFFLKIYRDTRAYI